MGYDPTTCANKLKAASATPICDQVPGAPYHCLDLVNLNPALHTYCATFYDPQNPDNPRYIYAPVQATACMLHNADGVPIEFKYFAPKDMLRECGKLNAKNPNWYADYCYCCCGCFAYDTMVAVPEGIAAIQSLAVGAQVLAASVAREGGKVKLTWEPMRVTFSSGVSGGHNPAMVYLAFGSATQTAGLICSPDQVFMLADGRLITAERLRVSDKLMDKNGDPVAIHTVAIGSFTGGVHHIGTGTKLAGDINGHLLLAGGVVAGDYALQLNFPNVSAELKSPDFEARAELGSARYNEFHGANMATAHLLFSSTGQTTDGHIAVHSGVFKVFAPAANLAIDGEVASLFTPDQAAELLDKGKQMPLSNPINRGMVNNLFCSFRGFFPELWFYLDWYRLEPNVYAMERFGKKVVVVSGGLARMIGLEYEGMAMAIAHAVSRLVGRGPKGMYGMTATGAADYQAFGLVSREIWYGNHWLRFTMAGYNQLQPIFKLLSETGGGNPADPLNQPSVDCRLSAMQSAIGGGDLPECAGGPKLQMIELQNVTATESGAVLTLSSAPVLETATVASNYVIEPAIAVTAATVDEKQDFVVHLAAKLKPGAYKVTIRNLTTYLGGEVDPAHNALPFTVTQAARPR